MKGGSVLRETKSRIYRIIVDELLPVVTNLGDIAEEGVHHRDIPYHEHEGVQMHLDVFTPTDKGPHPVIVAYHGGGWMFGIRKNLQRACRYLARQGFVVFNCSYRLAPSHLFPAGVQDALCALRWVQEHGAEYGGDTTRIGVLGDSAGGQLSAMMAVGQHSPVTQPLCSCARQCEVNIEAAVHFYGIYDFTRFQRLRFPFVRGIMREVFGEDRNNLDVLRSVSPEHLARRGHIPPTLLFCGKRDPLFQETREYGRRLAALGADVAVRIYPKAYHGFIYLWWTPEYEDSMRVTADHFKRHLGQFETRHAA
jgi:acetyl esterase